MRVWKRVTGNSLDPPEAHDSQIIEESYEGVYASLLADGLVSWGPTPVAEPYETDIIPEAVKTPLTGLIYEDVKGIYGKGEANPAMREVYRREMARILANPYTPDTTEAEYF